jgi:hypothetical protein
VIGFSLQYELQYTNVLMMLELAGMPLHARERDERHALVIAGGAQAFSPEPMRSSSTRSCSATARDVIHAVVERVKLAQARGTGARAAAARPRPPCAASTVPSGYAAARHAEGRLVPVARPGFPERVHSVG